VVLQVLADAREIVDDLDPQLRQLVGGADARQEQEVRRADGAAGEQDLARG
jgi:hypothetical protein